MEYLSKKLSKMTDIQMWQGFQFATSKFQKYMLGNSTGMHNKLNRYVQKCICDSKFCFKMGWHSFDELFNDANDTSQNTSSKSEEQF